MIGDTLRTWQPVCRVRVRHFYGEYQSGWGVAYKQPGWIFWWLWAFHPREFDYSYAQAVAYAKQIAEAGGFFWETTFNGPIEVTQK